MPLADRITDGLRSKLMALESFAGDAGFEPGEAMGLTPRRIRSRISWSKEALSLSWNTWVASMASGLST
jgi:hypothetical protein